MHDSFRSLQNTSVAKTRLVYPTRSEDSCLRSRLCVDVGQTGTRPSRGNGGLYENCRSRRQRLVLQAKAVEDTSSMFFDPIGPRFGLLCP
jgi:hypothetical protein